MKRSCVLTFLLRVFFIVITILLSNSVLVAQLQTIFQDDFNRIDGPLISPWEVMEDTLYIHSNQINGKTNKYGLVRFTSVADSSQIVELLVDFNFMDDTDGRFQFFIMGDYIFGVGYGYSAIISRSRFELHTVVPEAPLFQKPISLQGNTLYFLDFKIDASLENVTVTIYTSSGTRVESLTAPSPKRNIYSIACGIENNNDSQKTFDNTNFLKEIIAYNYLEPRSITINTDQEADIFGRIFIPQITTQQNNDSLIKATLLLSNADLPGFQGDPRFEEYNVAKYSAVYNSKIVDRYEYKATIKGLPVGNYKFCYKYEYNNETQLAGAEGYPGWFWTGTLKVVSTSTSMDDLNEIPNCYALYQNYPNPFNPITIINYSVPKTSFVTIKIFDVLGNEIKTLVKEEKIAGNHSLKFNANKLTSGIYLYRMQADNFSETKKFILLK